MSAYRDPRNGRFIARDGLANLASGAGTSVDKRAYAFYTRPYILPEQIEAAYRSSWFMRKGIDLPPFDMTRQGREWQLEEADVDKVEAEEKRLGVWDKLRQALVLGRLGGGLIVLGLQSNSEQPIGDADRKPGALKYLHVMNRWQVSLGPLVRDPMDPLFGQPAYFQINFGSAKSAGNVKLHPSRVIAFKGQQVPNLYGGVGDEWFWGDPVMLTVQDAVKNADAALNGFAALIEEAKLDSVSIPGLTQLVSTADGEAMVKKRVEIANLLKSTHNTRILDGGKAGVAGSAETWETRQVAWSGMPDVIRVYAATVAAAFDIPATRFLGKSPDGMNATGTGDEANYIAKIRAEQDAFLRPALSQLDDVLLPSAGVANTAEANYDFPELQEMSELDRATIFKSRMDGITALDALGVIPKIALEKAIQHTAVEENWLAGLDGALAEIPEDERFNLTPDPELGPDGKPIDPNVLTQTNGGKEVIPASAVAPAGGGSASRRRAANDAARFFADAQPRPLYVQRKLINAGPLIAWAKANGFTSTLPADQMHVTVLYSRSPVDPMKMGESWSGDDKGNVTIKPGGPRAVERLGANAVVLLFASWEIESRHRSMVEAGGSHDFDSYQPHVTISYEVPADFDLSAVKPYTGALQFGPELFEPLNEDWKSGVTEE